MAAAREQGRAVLAIRRGVGALVAVVALLLPVVLVSPATAVPRAASAPIDVSVIVPLTLDAGADGLLDAAELQVATSPTGSLARELDEVLGTSATIALDPMILASIRVLGSNAPDTAVAWLDRLRAAPNEVFLLAYADADLSPLARASSLDLAAPLDFGFALDEAAFGPAQTTSPTPVATPSPTETPGGDEPPPLPTTDDLLAWPDAVGRIAWPSPGSVAASDLPAYTDAGYDAILLSSANVSETAGAHADLDGFSGLIADSSASDLFDEASTSVDDATRDQAIDRLGAALDGLAAAHPGRSVVLTLDRRSTFAFFSLQETFAAIAARESTRMSTVSEVLNGAAEAARVVDGATQPQVVEGAALADAIRAEAAFATILEDSVLLTAPRRLQLLALLAVQDVAEPEWLDDARAFLERSAEILDSVTVVDTGRVLVASSQT